MVADAVAKDIIQCIGGILTVGYAPLGQIIFNFISAGTQKGADVYIPPRRDAAEATAAGAAQQSAENQQRAANRNTTGRLN